MIYTDRKTCFSNTTYFNTKFTLQKDINECIDIQLSVHDIWKKILIIYLYQMILEKSVFTHVAMGKSWLTVKKFSHWNTISQSVFTYEIWFNHVILKETWHFGTIMKPPDAVDILLTLYPYGVIDPLVGRSVIFNEE